MLNSYLVVMVVGGLGYAARMWLSNFLSVKYGPAFPVGTLVVNVLGCFAIGLFAGMKRPDGALLISPLVRQAIVIGFLGGFTTFFSFALQTLVLFNEGEWTYVVLNITLSVTSCLLAVSLGQLFAQQVVRG